MTSRFLRTRFAISICFAGAVLLPAIGGFAYGQSKPAAGLSLTFEVKDGNAVARDVTTSPNIQLYVSAGKPATPFLPGERFSASWSGMIGAELRGDYAFQADLNGSLKLEINGEMVLAATNSGGLSALGKVVRLNKGSNALTALYSSPVKGDAYLRLLWKPKESFLQPIPSAAFSSFSSDALQRADKLRRGRELVIEHRCARCHASPRPGSEIPDLSMDAPALEGIGARRNANWLARWIADPKALRPTARMPKVFHGEESKDQALAVAAYLASLKPGGPSEKVATLGASEEGRKLFETLHCSACHNAPETPGKDLNKISLDQMRGKFSPETLPAFLKQPDAHYGWIRMPRFKLSDEQRSQISAYLLSGDTTAAPDSPSEPNLVERGRKLVETSGCLNCHSTPPANPGSKPLLDLKWQQGCLAETESKDSKAPFYGFSESERESLRLFGQSDKISLTRHVPAEFAHRQIRNLNCAQCHGQIEGIPPVEILGEKLRPEWAAKFIAGEVAFKPRPWLEAQMPAFAKRADLLAEGMAMQHGFPPNTPAEPTIDREAARIGQKLVSAPPLGFSCVSCHSVGAYAATEVFEAPGINLAYSAERLLPSFARRWIHNPISIDPLSKMPVYFDEQGKSPLADVYEGDGWKQINAIWEYIRLGAEMPAPKPADSP